MPNLKKYFSLKGYARYTLHQLNIRILHHLDIALASQSAALNEYPPVFIIGPPRSGSTLLFQVLADAFDIAYLSNLHCYFFGAPALAERFFRPLDRRAPSDYNSFHGKTKGLDAPSECGEWWYRFFRRNPPYVTLKDVDTKKMHALRRSLAAFTQSTGKSLLFKNLYASLRLEPLSKYIPEALYIEVSRDEFYNAASILSGRKKALGNYNQWWSVPPANVKQLQQMPPCKQVVGQIRSIHAEINRAISQGYVEKNRLLRITYENLCRDTHATIDLVAAFWESHGLKAGKRFKIPRNFPIIKEIKLDVSMREELMQAVTEKYYERK